MKKLYFIVNILSPQAKIIEETILKEIDWTRFSVAFKFSDYKGHAKELGQAAINESVDV